MIIASKVRGYRSMLKLSQKDMARQLGISQTAYRNKESGKVDFKDREKVEILKILRPFFPEVTIEDIFFN